MTGTSRWPPGPRRRLGAARRRTLPRARWHAHGWRNQHTGEPIRRRPQLFPPAIDLSRTNLGTTGHLVHHGPRRQTRGDDCSLLVPAPTSPTFQDLVQSDVSVQIPGLQIVGPARRITSSKARRARRSPFPIRSRRRLHTPLAFLCFDEVISSGGLCREWLHRADRRAHQDRL